ncbi:hypothetical protein CHS0354_025236 [Potamilus streckersoni]|uniref:Secreted protein n=1 Tax=Potamilus streckersoni TaxID=2493646 RepID=A0AAE0RS11_9BIVA|nr:hypothetical protein CHS0354_025236 [Potamilus streckersoni]
MHLVSVQLRWCFLLLLLCSTQATTSSELLRRVEGIKRLVYGNDRQNQSERDYCLYDIKTDTTKLKGVVVYKAKTDNQSERGCCVYDVKTDRTKLKVVVLYTEKTERTKLKGLVVHKAQTAITKGHDGQNQAESGCCFIRQRQTEPS